MRLAQVSRKINIKPTLIIRFLQAESKEKNDFYPGTKINGDTLSSLIKHFDYQKNTDLEREDFLVPQSAETTTFFSETERLETERNETDSDVIRVPKVEIEGIKVVGKIELPEQKEKTEETKEENAVLKEPSRSKERRKKSPQKKSLRAENLSYEEEKKRSKEAQEENLRKKQELAKKKKREHYKKMMQERKAEKSGTKRKASIPNQKKDKGVKENQQSPVSPPKGIWGKFIKWLNN